MSDQNSIFEFLDSINNTEADVSGVISEGLSNLKSKISSVETRKEEEEPEKETPEPKVEPTSELADKAIHTYKTKIAPAKGVEAGEVEISHPVTKASQEVMKATIRSLTNRQGSGNVGKTSPTLPSGAGNVGTPGPAPIAVSTLSMEDYKAEVWGSLGIVELEEGEKPYPYDKVGDKLRKVDKDLPEEVDLVSVLEEALIDSDVSDWMQVDYVCRQVCEEHGVSLKQLNNLFKEENGSYPDKWVKNKIETTQCGWMPLDEATRVNKVGLVYEVSFMHRGHVNRFKFFWPAITRPSKEEMQKTIEGFYPKAKVLAFYPATKQDDNFMVIVPPMSEHVEVLHWDNWSELSEEDNTLLHIISEEVGEPMSPAIPLEEGGYLINVADHDNGEEIAVTFGEGILGLEFKKKSPDERAAKKREKKINELERLVKHVSNPLSDVSRPKTQVKEDWQKTNRNDKTDGMSSKAVKQYRRENPGSKLKTAVTTEPSKLDPDSKAAKRRKNFCSRSRGWDGEKGKAARARWNC